MLAGIALLGACTTSDGPPPVTPAPEPPPPLEQPATRSTAPDAVEVHALLGKAVLLWRGRRWLLEPDTEIDPNQPVQVGADSALRLRMGDSALLDLGPDTRFVIEEPTPEDAGVQRVTRLRVDQGYLRVVASDEHRDVVMDVSFGPWKARIGAGEHFFEAGAAQASACSTNGSIALEGIPGWRPRSGSAPCVMLFRDRPAVQISLDEGDWEYLRRNRRLYPTLASVVQRDAMAAARALLEAAPPAAGTGSHPGD